MVIQYILAHAVCIIHNWIPSELESGSSGSVNPKTPHGEWTYHDWGHKVAAFLIPLC